MKIWLTGRIFAVFSVLVLAGITLQIGGSFVGESLAQSATNDPYAGMTARQIVESITDTQGGAAGVASQGTPSLSNPYTCSNVNSVGSTNYNPNSEWSTSFVPVHENYEYFRHYQNFLDVNGDGLPDFVSTYRMTGNSTTVIKDCVLLNNGSGWDLAYACVGAVRSGEDWFVGHCAQ